MVKQWMKTGFIERKCPKCGGNLYYSEDSYLEGGLMDFYEHESCLQCGYDCYDGKDYPVKIAVCTTAAQGELLHV